MVVTGKPNLRARHGLRLCWRPEREVIRARAAGWRVSRQWQMRRPWGVLAWLLGGMRERVLVGCVVVMRRCKWTPLGGGEDGRHMDGTSVRELMAREGHKSRRASHPRYKSNGQ